MDMRQAYENKRFMQPLDLPLNMDDWQPSSLTERRQTIFENALFSFVLILCAVDHLNHADAIEPNDEERKMPTSLELMQLENEDKLVNSRYDILVNELLFQFRIWIDYLKKMGEEMFPDSEPSLWTCVCCCTSSWRRFGWRQPMGIPLEKWASSHFSLQTWWTSVRTLELCAQFWSFSSPIIWWMCPKTISIGWGTTSSTVGEKRAQTLLMMNLLSQLWETIKCTTAIHWIFWRNTKFNGDNYCTRINSGVSCFPFLLNAYCSFFKLTNADGTYIRSFF